MKTAKRSLLAAFAAILTALSAAVTAYAAEPAGQSREIYESTGDYFVGLLDGAALEVGSTGGEWIVIGLARSSKLSEAQAEAYYKVAAEFVADNANDKEQLHRAKSTENSRLILALTAIGKDVTDIQGHNLLQGLSDQSYLEKQGINGPIWALIALDSGGYEIPAVAEGGRQASRESILETILQAQLEDGLWGLNGMKSDPDTTGMALQALAPYYDSSAEVKTAIDAALAGLSAMQAEDGSFVSTGFFGGVSNAESIAQIVVALTALGIDPHTDLRFVKNGRSVIDALCAFAVEGGGFCHVAGGTRDGMASEQGYYALAAYFRFLDGKTGLYDMSDLKADKKPDEDKDSGGTPDEDKDSGGKPDEDKDSGDKPSEDGGTSDTPPAQAGGSPYTGDRFSAARQLRWLVLSSLGILLMMAAGKRKIGR